MAELVVSERGEEVAAAGELHQLRRDDCSATGRLRPDLVAGAICPAAGRRGHPGELDPLDMTDDGASHDAAGSHVSLMMAAVAIPPFERFYLEHRDEVLGYLRRCSGSAPRTPGRRHSCARSAPTTGSSTDEHLRAWVFTIATTRRDRRSAFEGK